MDKARSLGIGACVILEFHPTILNYRRGIAHLANKVSSYTQPQKEPLMSSFLVQAPPTPPNPKETLDKPRSLGIGIYVILRWTGPTYSISRGVHNAPTFVMS